mgnify:CR=1 FL=1
MHYAVIAAGEGSRLVEDGIALPKPLISLSGQPMLGRLLEIFIRNQAECICVIINQQMTVVQQYLDEWKELHPSVDVRVMVKSTPSSMHSLYELCTLLPEGPFVCTTVDTVFKEKNFADYVAAYAAQSDSFLFGVTPFVEDEKPLWVKVDGDNAITQFCDEGPAPYVSGGIYGMDKAVAKDVLEKCLSSGKSRMRNFQRALLESGIKVKAHIFEKVMDIDHRSDLEHAEMWLAQSQEDATRSCL